MSEIQGRSKFSQAHDKRLLRLVEEATRQAEEIDWKRIGDQMGKTPRQCRERYKHYLCPGLKRDPWTQAEDELLTKQVSLIGCRWVKICEYFPGRNDVNLKNRWNLIKNRREREGNEDVKVIVNEKKMTEEENRQNWIDTLFMGEDVAKFFAETVFGSKLKTVKR